MNTLLAPLVPALGWALLNFLWQGILIGLVVVPLLGLLRSARPQARYALLLVALFTCICLPTVAVLRSFYHPGPAVVAATDGLINAQWLDGAGSAPAQAWQAQWQAQLPWVVAVWSLGASLLALRLVLGLSWVARTRSASCWRYSASASAYFWAANSSFPFGRLLSFFCANAAT